MKMPSKRTRLKLYVPFGVFVIAVNILNLGMNYPDLQWFRALLIVFVYYVTVRDLRELRTGVR